MSINDFRNFPMYLYCIYNLFIAFCYGIKSPLPSLSRAMAAPEIFHPSVKIIIGSRTMLVRLPRTYPIMALPDCPSARRIFEKQFAIRTNGPE